MSSPFVLNLIFKVVLLLLLIVCGVGAIPATITVFILSVVSRPLGPGRTRRAENMSEDAGEEISLSAADILVVREMLRKGKKLPDEIVIPILDYAEYWSSSRVLVDYTAYSSGWRSIGADDEMLLRAPPIGYTTGPDDHAEAHEVSTVMHPVRKIIFRITSSDQGWGGERAFRGTFQGSYTWFEAGHERTEVDEKGNSTLRWVYPEPSGTETPQRFNFALHASPTHTIQSNRSATPEEGTYTIVWSWEDNIQPDTKESDELEAQGRGKASGSGEFVRSLRVGDVVSVWAKRRYPGWQNVVRRVEMEIYWAVV